MTTPKTQKEIVEELHKLAELKEYQYDPNTLNFDGGLLTVSCRLRDYYPSKDNIARTIRIAPSSGSLKARTFRLRKCGTFNMPLIKAFLEECRLEEIREKRRREEDARIRGGRLAARKRTEAALCEIYNLESIPPLGICPTEETALQVKSDGTVRITADDLTLDQARAFLEKIS